ncbi:DUF805 domain-containing protein [Sphingosinicella sp. YJ22]|uniref:DUF805 domain-containing protein n=1 Tax=Sphingosinicella sp. YJ22 TaxID=1104780 RepID=UPI0014083957|nr:DUF805 domain-containing protein [Sphingosinicella sp. YJ22]
MNWMLLPLRRYADFSGRSRRMEFWMWQLFLFLVNFVLMIIAFAIIGGAMFSVLRDNPDAFDARGDYSYDGAYYADSVPPDAALATIGVAGIVIFGLLFLWWLVILVPNIAVAVRRLHDTNRSGWWLLAPLAPYAIGVIALMMAAAVPDLLILAGIIWLVAILAAFGLGIMLLVFYFLEGTRGPNRFGPDPKGPTHEETFR